MKKRGSRLAMTAALLFWGGWVAFSGTSSADMEIQKQAKAAGATVKDCTTCHVDKLPKKDAHEPNEVGKWLIAEKEKRKAAKVDGAWLKDYPGKK
jgi:hypothetical protein